MALRPKNPVEPTGVSGVGKVYKPPTLTISTDIPHPDVADRTSQGMKTREITLTTPKGKVTAGYGRQRLAGKVQYTFKSGRDLFVVKELCHGECDSLVAIDAGGGEITTPFIFNSNFQFWFYPGTPAGHVDPNLAAVDGTWNEAFPGVCYVVEKYSNVGTYWSELLNTIYYVKGRKCLDSSNPTGPRIYSENVWDQWFDFVLWSEGKALPLSRVNAASFAAAKAADIAASRSMDCHMLLMEPQNPDDVINTFRLIASAWWFWDANQFLVVADRAASPVVTYDNRHLVDQSAPRLNRDDVVDRPNRAVGYFTDVTNKWQRTKVPGAAVETAGVTNGLEEPIEVEYEFPWIHDAAVARSRLVYILNSHQFDGKLSVPWMAATADRQLGDLVTQNVAARGLVFTGRLLRRMKDMATNTFDVVLHEYNAAKFNYDPVSNPAKTPSTLPDPAEAPTEVTGFNTASIFEVLYQEQPGVWKSRARLTGTLPNFQWLDAVEIHLSISGGPYAYLDEFSGGPAAAFDVVVPTVMEIGVQYNFKLVVRSAFQQRSTGVIASKTFQGKTAPPADLQYVVASQRGRKVLVSWQPDNERDYVAFEVRRGPIGSTWESMDRVGQPKGFEYEDEAPLGSWNYAVKAIDAAQRYSTNAKYAIVRVFFYGVREADEIVEPFYLEPSDVAASGDTGWSMGFLGKFVIEGISVKSTMTFMLCRSLSPTTADSEISAGSHASVSAWESAVDSPRRTDPSGTVQGIWSPLDDDTNGKLPAFIRHGHSWSGDANGWRNCDFKFRIGGSIQMLGYVHPTVIRKAEASNSLASAIWEPYFSSSLSFWQGDWAQSPIQFSDYGAEVALQMVLSTNSRWSQAIWRPLYSAVYSYNKNQWFPQVLAPTDVVSDSGGDAVVTYPKAMRFGNQVPYPSAEIVSAHNALLRLTSVGASSVRYTVINPTTGATMTGVTVRIAAEDRGGGGSFFEFF